MNVEGMMPGDGERDHATRSSDAVAMIHAFARALAEYKAYEDV